MTSTVKQWTNISAGPRQLKDLTKAISALQWEGRNREEVYGVIGGEERRSVVAAMMAPVRDEVVKLDEEIREAYGYQLTSGNIRAVIAAYDLAMPKAQESRPVDDNRRTAEEDAAITARMAALRAAAAVFPETAHLATGDTERRENYSMGGGNFLSDHGSSDSGSGWVVRSRDLPCAYVSLTQDAVPEPSAAPEPVPAPRTATPAASKPARATAVSDDVLDILRGAEVDGRFVKIAARLDREAYVKLAAVVKDIGGKWNRGAQAFLFSEDAAPVLAKLLNDGSVVRPQDEGWFPTPAPVVARLLEVAGVKPGKTVLEPSAGEGAIARAAAAAGAVVDAVEQNAKRAAVLYATGAARSVTMGDFLAQPARQEYDAVLMNPPFADKADIAHVLHAVKFVNSGGVLAAVMSAGVTFRKDRQTAEFRESWLAGGGTFEPLPDDSFQESGTGVRTFLAVITI